MCGSSKVLVDGPCDGQDGLVEEDIGILQGHPMLLPALAPEIPVRIDGAESAHVHLDLPLVVQTHGPDGIGLGVPLLAVEDEGFHVRLLQLVVGTVHKSTRLPDTLPDGVVDGIPGLQVGIGQLDQFFSHTFRISWATIACKDNTFRKDGQGGRGG